MTDDRHAIDARHVIGVERRNVLFLTLDSLRYDVARAALAAGRTPALASVLPYGHWEERRTPGTFTYPAHQAFFAGFLPKPARPSPPPRLWECRPTADKRVPPTTHLFEAPDIVRGFAHTGYRTVCVGGVSYFSSTTPLGSVFPAMFEEAYWRPEFDSPEPDSTRHQVEQALAALDRQPPDPDRPAFLFMNVSATHVPHHHYLPEGCAGGEDGWDSQFAALCYADTQLGRLLDELPRHGSWLVVICADHGDAFGEDGYTGHGIAHPTVWTVPFTEALL